MISLKEFHKRLRALQAKGLEVEVIGRKPQPLKVLKERALQRFVHHLVFGDSGRGIGITISGAPQIKAERISLGLVLDIPLGKRKLRLSREDRRLLEKLLIHAIEERARLQHFGSVAGHSRHRGSPGRSPKGS